MLLLTGIRPGELTHLLLPDDVDLTTGWLHIRNKKSLGWRIKTRNERDIPLHPNLAEVLKRVIGTRRCGPLVRQRRCSVGFTPPLANLNATQLESEINNRIASLERSENGELSRQRKQAVANRVWRESGAIREDWVRIEFMRVTKAIGLPYVTAPKTFRHTFATILQDANVDPLIRNELMGHAPMSNFSSAPGLGTTSIYTHTRPETKRQQLENALQGRPALECAYGWPAATD